MECVLKWICSFLFSLSLFGCSNSPNYYRPPPDTCDGAPGCAVSAIIDGIIYTEPAPTKCSEMSGEQRKRCNAQVDAVKRSIKKAQEN
ncbi:hypothetical protein A9Q75_11460 [Colwellia psychrerythraea]|uniref:Lipoprotein n=1 Tax=Colwellia psychrerythraea TaxID=28229 RepID=A0A1Y5EAZ0_COLPS|nr:hypothetical protein A9Q75_11460 [Colwellia psychrerythraea]